MCRHYETGGEGRATEKKDAEKLKRKRRFGRLGGTKIDRETELVGRRKWKGARLQRRGKAREG